MMVSKSGCLGVCSDEGVTVAFLGSGGRRVVVVDPNADRDLVWEQIQREMG